MVMNLLKPNMLLLLSTRSVPLAVRSISKVNYDSSAHDFPRISVHLASIHHQAPLVAPRPTHQPLPQHAVNAVEHHGEHVGPRVVGDQVPEEAAARMRHEALVGHLQVVKVDGLFAVGAVTVAEDVQPGLHAPYFSQEVRTAEINVQVVFLDEYSLSVS